MVAAIDVVAGERRISLPTLTNSSAKAYRACPRLYYYTYELGYRPITDTSELAFGTIHHSLQEAWWMASMTGAPLDEWLPCALSALPPDLDPYDRARHTALFTGYHCRWTIDGAHTWEGRPIKVLHVEHEFNGPLINPVTQAPSRTWLNGGKMDVVVQVAERVYVVEHKTSKEDISPGSDYWRRLKLNSQISRYVAGARMLGYDPAGCIYNVVGKPVLRPLKATSPEDRKYTKPTKANPEPRLYANQREDDETPDEFERRLLDAITSAPDRYYSRGLIVRLSDDERDAAWDTWTTGIQIRDSRRANIWPRNDDACMRYGRTCAFLPVCSREGSLDDRTRYRKAAAMHEELGAAPATSSATDTSVPDTDTASTTTSSSDAYSVDNGSW